MIIKYPTGLYNSVIPEEPSDKGNVTYLISMTSPPRANLVYPKVPIGVISRHKEPKVIDLIERRDTFGILVYTISKASRLVEGNNAKQYEVGQVLDFDNASGKAVEPMLVNPVTEIRHDQNLYDYAQMGLSEDEQKFISDTSLLTANALTEQLNDLKRLRADAEQIINVNQKLINDLTKTIESLTITLEYTAIDSSSGTEPNEVEELISRLEQRKNQAFIARDQAILDANQYATESNIVLDKLRSVGVLVR